MSLFHPQLFSTPPPPPIAAAVVAFAGAQRNKHAVTLPHLCKDLRVDIPLFPQVSILLSLPLFLADILSTAVTVDSSLNRGEEEKTKQQWEHWQSISPACSTTLLGLQRWRRGGSVHIACAFAKGEKLEGWEMKSRDQTRRGKSHWLRGADPPPPPLFCVFLSIF